MNTEQVREGNSWIDPEAWNGFVEMRKSIKRPLTAHAMKLLVHKLTELKAKGHDPNACLDQSSFHNWQSVYPVNGSAIPDMTPKTYESPAPMTPEEQARADAARELVMQAFKLKRVA